MYVPSSLLRSVAALSVLLLAPAAGCVGLTVQVANMLGMNFEPAAYAGLKGKRVAVVCSAPESAYGPETDGELLADNLERYLGQKVRNIEFVPRQEVLRWLDVHSGDLLDYPRMGKSLKADAVLVVDQAMLSYGEDATFYQGKADYTLAVYDTETGERLYGDENPDLVYPKNNAYDRMDMKPDKFKRAFLAYLATEIGRRFHANDFPKQFSREPPIY